MTKGWIRWCRRCPQHELDWTREELCVLDVTDGNVPLRTAE